MKYRTLRWNNIGPRGLVYKAMTETIEFTFISRTCITNILGYNGYLCVAYTLTFDEYII